MTHSPLFNSSDSDHECYSDRKRLKTQKRQVNFQVDVSCLSQSIIANVDSLSVIAGESWCLVRTPNLKHAIPF